MTKLVLVMLAATWVSVPALASDAAMAPEPIGVAVAPPDNGLPKGVAAAQIPAAESKVAISSSEVAERDKTSTSQLDNGGPGLALKIKPFGWVIRLFGRCARSRSC